MLIFFLAVRNFTVAICRIYGGGFIKKANGYVWLKKIKMNPKQSFFDRLINIPVSARHRFSAGRISNN